MDFRERAQFEAERYGADAWIFVRELLQNARDAGATRVVIEISEREDSVHLTCRDDGEGMTEEHAKKFLFRLYASSKEGQVGAAGRFGVGFWSILRFDPTRIVVRSWPKRGNPWQVTLDGQLENASTVTPPQSHHGTELVLVRSLTPEVARHVKEAARMHGRYLLARGTSKLLEVVIDGEHITEEISLPAPSATFQRRGVRGVVGLGTGAHVELFSKGLHVRTAASVDELLASPDDGKARQLDPLLEGLAPQVILDGDELNLVRSRSDARDDKALRRAVELSRKELARLIERQLQFSRPVPWWKRALRPALAIAAVTTFVAGGAWLASSFLRQRSTPHGVVIPPPPAPEIARRPRPEPYRDPAPNYRGPRTDALPTAEQPIDLTYSPASKNLHFAALHLRSPHQRPTLEGAMKQHPAFVCAEDCVRMSLTVADLEGWVRLPVPTGYVIVPGSLRWGDGAPRDVYRTPEGEPLVWGTGQGTAQIFYRVGPGAPYLEADDWNPDIEIPAEVPDVSAYRSVGAKVDRLRAWVSENIEYTNDPKVGELTRVTGGKDFITRALKVGAGDCDVQNGVLALLLSDAGVPARLTIGHVGRAGHAEPLLHAWVEYWNNGQWNVTDASINGATRPVAGAREYEPMPRLQSGVRQQMVTLDGRKVPYEFARALYPDAFKPKQSSGFQILVPRFEVPSSVFGLLGAAPLLALAFMLLRPRVKRQTSLDSEHDVSLLLQGALARPEAFHHVPALFEQPLVPKRGGGYISLGQAYELAAAEQLYSSDAGLPFTERSIKDGAVVLDMMRPEGKVVADALGAVNLDRWDRVLRSVTIPPLLEQVNAALRSRGERWMVMMSELVTGEPAVLTVPGTKDERWVVLNRDAQWLHRAGVLAEDRPVRAVFQVIDEVVLWLRLPSARRARLLAPLAKAAMHEELNPPVRPPEPERQRELSPVESFDDQPGATPKGKVRS